MLHILANGLFYCVHSETVGDVQYVVTINPEAVDYVTTFKFTCFVCIYYLRWQKPEFGY